jgi:hypothetical protein
MNARVQTDAKKELPLHRASATVHATASAIQTVMTEFELHMLVISINHGPCYSFLPSFLCLCVYIASEFGGLISYKTASHLSFCLYTSSTESPLTAPGAYELPLEFLLFLLEQLDKLTYHKALSNVIYHAY